MHTFGSWIDAGMDEEERNGFLELLEAVGRVLRLARRNASRARLSLKVAVGLFVVSTAAYVTGFVRPYWIVTDHHVSGGDADRNDSNAADKTYSGVWEDCRLYRGQRDCTVFIRDIDSVVAMLGCVGGALHLSVCVWTLLACLRSPRRKRRVITVVGAVFGGFFGLSCAVLFIAVHGKQPYSWGLVLNLGGSVLALVASVFVAWTLRHTKASGSMTVGKKVRRSANRKGVSLIVVKDLPSGGPFPSWSPPRKEASRSTLLATADRVGGEAEFLDQATASSPGVSLPTSLDRPRLPGTSSPSRRSTDSSPALSSAVAPGRRHSPTTSTTCPESQKSAHQEPSQTMTPFLTREVGYTLHVNKVCVTQVCEKGPKGLQTTSAAVSPPVPRDQMEENSSAPIRLDTPAAPLPVTHTAASFTLSPTPSEISRAFFRTRDMPHRGRHVGPKDTVTPLPYRAFYRQHLPHKKPTSMCGGQGKLSPDDMTYHSVSYFSPEQKFVSFKPQTSPKRRRRDDFVL